MRGLAHNAAPRGPDLENKTIIEELIKEVDEYVQRCKLLRVHVELLLRFNSHLEFIEEWYSVRSRRYALGCVMESLDWRCDNAAVPIIELA